MGVCHKLELFGDAEYQKMKPLKQSNSVLGLIVGVNLSIVAATKSTNSTIWIIWYDISYILLRHIDYGPWKMTLATYEKWYDFWLAWISSRDITLLSSLDTSSGNCSLNSCFLDIFHVVCSISYASYNMIIFAFNIPRIQKKDESLEISLTSGRSHEIL